MGKVVGKCELDPLSISEMILSVPQLPAEPAAKQNKSRLAYRNQANRDFFIE